MRGFNLDSRSWAAVLLAPAFALPLACGGIEGTREVVAFQDRDTAAIAIGDKITEAQEGRVELPLAAELLLEDGGWIHIDITRPLPSGAGELELDLSGSVLSREWAAPKKKGSEGLMGPDQDAKALKAAARCYDRRLLCYLEALRLMEKVLVRIPKDAAVEISVE